MIEKTLRAFALPFLFLFICFSAAFGANGLIEKKGPITITSSTLNADNKAHTALFEGSVVAKTTTWTIYSDKMLVYYAEGGKVTKIEIQGHARLVSGVRVITSDAATYFEDEEKVIFTGEPRAVEGCNIVTGSKMIYFVKEDRSIVENSKVIMDKEGGCGR